MKVPLLDLQAQYAPIKGQILHAVAEVVASCQFINGPAVKQLEQALCEHVGAAAAVGVSSGTDALLCGLMALGVGLGDEVITTPYTFFATAGSIARVGARPVFVDIEPDTFNLDATKLAAAVTPRTKAIMPVHLFGQMADMDAIMSVAAKHNLAVIEDAAQSIGSTYKGRQCGTMGTMGCFSFFPSKNLGTLGDGGMIVTGDKAFGEKLAIFRNHGSQPKYYHKWVGGNFRLDTIHAAALLVKLPHLKQWTDLRRANAARYDRHFAGCDAVKTPVIRQHNTSIYNQYVIRVPRRNELMEFLKQAEIGTEVYYPVSMHLQECFAYLGYKRGDFPNAEAAQDTSLALPIYGELTGEQIAYVAGKVKEFFE